jgi:hypothetical protein
MLDIYDCSGRIKLNLDVTMEQVAPRDSKLLHPEIFLACTDLMFINNVSVFSFQMANKKKSVF